MSLATATATATATAIATATATAMTKEWLIPFDTKVSGFKHNKTPKYAVMPSIAEEDSLKLEDSVECDISVVPSMTLDNNEENVDSYPIIYLPALDDIEVYSEADSYPMIFLPALVDIEVYSEEGFLVLPQSLNLEDPVKDHKPMYFDAVNTIIKEESLLNCSRMNDSQKREYMALMLAKTQFFQAIFNNGIVQN